MTTLRLFIDNACHKCEKGGFQRKNNLRRHYAVVENVVLDSLDTGKRIPNIPQKYTRTGHKNNADAIMFACPCCSDIFDNLMLLGNHIDKHIHEGKTSCETDDLHQEGYSVKVAELPIIEPSLDLQVSPMTTSTISSSMRRTFDDAIIYACQDQDSDKEDKVKSLHILDNMHLRPFAVIDNEGVEHNALAHETVIRRLVSKHGTIHPILPLKRPFGDVESGINLCVKCTPPIDTDLMTIIAQSPYANLLRQRKLGVLPASEIFFGSGIGRFDPCNSRNNQALMINTIEMYGRTKCIDQHRETFGKMKDGVVATSHPPPIQTIHHGVWPVLLKGREGHKLVIGTEVSNALVTSSIRLDEKHHASIGGITTNFLLKNMQDSLACRIFVDTECLNKARTILSNPMATCVSSHGSMISQLRQLRTHFDYATTYTLCRASGPLTSSTICHPYILFTIAEHDRGRNSPAIIFRSIAVKIMKQGNTATLNKEDVNFDARGKTKEVMDKIRDLIGQNDNIPILNNQNLNAYLEELAKQMMPSIVACNLSVQKQVNAVFDFLN
ncbi:hypothetical protein G6F47_012423 [Rhizopus delemar]|nr:hypothetical protein G6F47_012423 [Rhizopus delemar]